MRAGVALDVAGVAEGGEQGVVGGVWAREGMASGSEAAASASTMRMDFNMAIVAYRVVVEAVVPRSSREVQLLNPCRRLPEIAQPNPRGRTRT
jgi:hypothetical protein